MWPPSLQKLQLGNGASAPNTDDSGSSPELTKLRTFITHSGRCQTSKVTLSRWPREQMVEKTQRPYLRIETKTSFPSFLSTLRIIIVKLI